MMVLPRSYSIFWLQWHWATFVPNVSSTKNYRLQCCTNSCISARPDEAKKRTCSIHDKPCTPRSSRLLPSREILAATLHPEETQQMAQPFNDRNLQLTTMQ